MVTLHDVTERRQAGERLQVVLGAQRQAVAVVAHEVKSPLTAIKGYADLLLLGGGSAGMNGREQWLARIRENVDRLAAIAERFLEADRLEGRLRARQSAHVSATELVRGVTEE